jgi:hypothetical protein
MNGFFKTYVQSLNKALAAGNASEHTHRPALKTFLEAIGPGITATNEPKKYTDCGKPDSWVFRGPVPLGSLETKDIGNNLDTEERTKQIKDYLQGLHNFILTNYEGVPPDTWAFQVGGYQVLHKWLKACKTRPLSSDDVYHFQKVVKALSETIRLMGEIDAAIEAHGGWPIS